MNKISKNELETIVQEAMIGERANSDSITQRKWYDVIDGVYRDLLKPHDGVVIKKIKEAIKDKYGVEVLNSFKIYSKEEEEDHILYIEHEDEFGITIYSVDVFEYCMM